MILHSYPEASRTWQSPNTGTLYYEGNSFPIFGPSGQGRNLTFSILSHHKARNIIKLEHFFVTYSEGRAGPHSCHCIGMTPKFAARLLVFVFFLFVLLSFGRCATFDTSLLADELPAAFGSHLNGTGLALGFLPRPTGVPLGITLSYCPPSLHGLCVREPSSRGTVKLECARGGSGGPAPLPKTDSWLDGANDSSPLEWQIKENSERAGERWWSGLARARQPMPGESSRKTRPGANTFSGSRVALLCM